MGCRLNTQKVIFLLMLTPLVLSFNNCSRAETDGEEATTVGPEAAESDQPSRMPVTTTTLRQVVTTTLRPAVTPTTTLRPTTTTVRATTTTTLRPTTTTTTLRPVVTTTTLNVPTTTTLPQGYRPTIASTVVPQGDLQNSIISNIGRQTIAKQWTGPTNFEGIKIAKYKWSQSAGPVPVFIRFSDQSSIWVYGMSTAGVYDYKLEATLTDGRVKTAYFRNNVSNTSEIKIYPTHRSVRIEFYKNGSLMRDGQIGRGDVIVPKVFYTKKIYNESTVVQSIEYEVDAKTISWYDSASTVDTACVTGDQSAGGYLADPTPYHYMFNGGTKETMANLYRGTVNTGYSAGSLVVKGLSKSGCRVYIESAAVVGAKTKAKDGTALGIPDFVSVEHGFILNQP